MYPAPGEPAPGGQWPAPQSGTPADPGGRPPYPPAPGSPAHPPAYGGHQPPTPQYGGAPQYGQPPEYGTPEYAGAPSPQYAPPPPPARRSRLPLVLGLVAGAVLLICGLGTVLVLVGGDDSSTEADPPAALATGSAPAPRASGAAAPGASPSQEEVEGDLDQFQKGDCLTMSEDNEIDDAKCSAPGAYKVLLRRNGTLADSACDSTEATDILTQDQAGTSRDFVLCIAKVS
ncbi:hypothetical protein AB0J86_11060 [Micromonospora sp. NPDC049559]|uniref:LppU/SCO3897 family protein n=1 Tax=Micromonospora sp. NPDC049559 TaxID=3155923 RepID=UPI0034274DDB